MSICHAEMVVTDPVWAYRQPALFFRFLQHFLPTAPQSGPRAFILCSVTAASLSSLGPAPRLQSPGSVPSVCLHPPLPPSLPTCMCSLGFRSITLKVEVALGGGGPSEAAPAAPAPAPPPSSACGSTPAWPCCLCKCRTGTQPHTNPQLSTELESRSLEFPPDNLHFWGLSVLSPAS